MRNNYKIVNAKKEDIHQIMDLERLGFLPGIIELESVFLERIEFFSDGFLLLKELKNNQIIGYICSEIWEYIENIDKEMFELNHSIRNLHSLSGEELYVSSMTIHPDFRGEKLGQLLFLECINQVIKKYTHIKSILLIVNETWQQAKNIYEQNGFNKVCHIPDFFEPTNSPPQKAIVMRKSLK